MPLGPRQIKLWCATNDGLAVSTPPGASEVPSLVPDYCCAAVHIAVRQPESYAVPSTCGPIDVLVNPLLLPSCHAATATVALHRPLNSFDLSTRSLDDSVFAFSLRVYAIRLSSSCSGALGAEMLPQIVPSFHGEVTIGTKRCLIDHVTLFGIVYLCIKSPRRRDRLSRASPDILLIQIFSALLEVYGVEGLHGERPVHELFVLLNNGIVEWCSIKVWPIPHGI